MNHVFGTETGELVPVTSEITDAWKQELFRAKQRIDPVEKEWDRIKRAIHDYEYVYTSSFSKRNVSAKVPISRSYFKMKEILHAFQISLDPTCRVTCIAEAPGGFAQCVREAGARVHGITLVSEDRKVPYWHRQLQEDPGISFHTGVSQNGDVCDFKNILAFIREIGPHTMDVVTGDGGFDNSGDYNHQEENSFPLIYSEIYLAMYLQKQGGAFICKIFDTFEPATIRLLALLRPCYETMSFYKPCLSRLSNSEKYVVCTGFKGCPTSALNQLTHHFEDHALQTLASSQFMRDIQEFHKIYVGQQMASIAKGLVLIQKRRFTKEPSLFQIDCATEWCRTYGIPMNRF
jgi:23S rRNA U2552 (ribose-2'-O)-methylase RlmE/FtsJ